MSAEPAGFAAATSKLEAVERLGRMANGVPGELGPGSKERKSLLVDMARRLSLTFPDHFGKVDIAEALVRHAGLAWDNTCQSAGDTITLSGLNRVLEAAEKDRLLPDASTTPEEGQNSMLDTGAPEQTDDERLAVEQEIRDNLAQLSLTGRYPSGRGGPQPFRPGDVDFFQGSWLQQVQEVDRWLYLESSLGGESPEELLRSLALGLGFSRPEDAIDLQADHPRLNANGLDALRRQSDTAVKIYSNVFEAELDKDAPDLTRAFRAWEEAWTDLEEPEDEADPGQPVRAKTTSWSITDFAARARRNQLNLSPTYQRGEVWPTTDAQLLIASILRGIPLPSVILLKSTDEQQTFEVVDGKQRLTSVLRFIGAHPVAVMRVHEYAARFPGHDLIGLFRTDYPKFRKTLGKLLGKPLTALEEKDHRFPYPLGRKENDLPGDLQRLAGKYFSEIADERINIAGTVETLEEVFTETSAYQIPVITFEEATPRQIHEVFNLYNKQGKHLNAEEIRNAVYHDVALTLALLATAGDVDDTHEPEDVTPLLRPIWSDLRAVSGHLGQYGLGAGRYRRTKMLSWVLSLLAFDARAGDDKIRLRSTAQHINAFFGRVQRDRNDSMRRADTVQHALQVLSAAVETHLALDDAWAPTFRGGKQTWEELTLVASLLGVALVVLTDPAGYRERLEHRVAELAERTSQKPWHRPAKTQTREQWSYLATVALGIVETAGLSTAEADRAVRDAFGASGVWTLTAVRGSTQKPAGMIQG